jgi:hypothetical protein
MWKEPDESEGHQVLRHLQGIVAWHAAAAASLVLNGKFAQSLVVGLVEVAPTKQAPDLMTSEEVIQEFLSRYILRHCLKPYRGYN